MFFPFGSKKQARHGYKGGEDHVILVKYTLNLPYIYPIFLSKINPIFLYNFGQKWLDTLLVVTHLPSMTMAKQENMHYITTRTLPRHKKVRFEY